MRRSKRLRTSAAPAVSHEDAQNDTPCYLLRLPMELLAEILSYIRAPTLLSLARTSKSFCNLLCDPGSSFIWKRARIDPDLLFAIPDPHPSMPEPAYAAMIFDPGKCYICQVPTSRMLHSYAFRARLCSKVRGLPLPTMYPLRNLFRERVKGSGMMISHGASLSHPSCNLHLILFS
jgi:hypothetical protein